MWMGACTAARSRSPWPVGLVQLRGRVGEALPPCSWPPACTGCRLEGFVGPAGRRARISGVAKSGVSFFCVAPRGNRLASNWSNHRRARF